jgi:DNA-binding transcriptional LysR family regulator
MFELRHLRHALGLAEHRNFARAALALHITQSALSRSIQSLEETMGVILFDRSHGGVEPTIYGQLLLKNARDLDLAARDLQREMELAKGMSSGELKIGVGPWGAAMLAGAVVGAMSVQYPQLRLTLVMGPWKELPARLHTREIDLAIINISDTRPNDEIELQTLLPHPALLLCRAHHPLTQRSAPTARDVFEFPMAAPNLPEGTSEKILSHLPVALRAAVLKRGLMNITCDSSSVLKSVIAHSDALTVMNAFMALDELRSGKLVALPGINMGVGGQFGVMRLRRRSLSTAAQRFMELLQAHDAALFQEEEAFLAALPYPHHTSSASAAGE